MYHAVSLPSAHTVGARDLAELDAKTHDKEKTIVRRLNKAALDHVVYAPLGRRNALRLLRPTGYRLTGALSGRHSMLVSKPENLWEVSMHRSGRRANRLALKAAKNSNIAFRLIKTSAEPGGSATCDASLIFGWPMGLSMGCSVPARRPPG